MSGVCCRIDAVKTLTCVHVVPLCTLLLRRASVLIQINSKITPVTDVVIPLVQYQFVISFARLLVLLYKTGIEFEATPSCKQQNQAKTHCAMRWQFYSEMFMTIRQGQCSVSQNK